MKQSNISLQHSSFLKLSSVKPEFIDKIGYINAPFSLKDISLYTKELGSELYITFSYIGKKAIGYQISHYETTDNYLYCNGLFIQKKYRNLGIARRLQKTQIALAKALKAKGFIVYCDNRDGENFMNKVQKSDAGFEHYQSGYRYLF